jgi:photosynthetic reaction center cytochrome c subunit
MIRPCGQHSTSVTRMKKIILKIVALSLLLLTSFGLLSNPNSAQGSRDHNNSPTVTQAASPENKVEQVFKNIKLLNEMPQSQLYPAMRFMAASLGVQCGFCHVFKNGQLDSAADEKPEKQTARAMIKMVLDINKNYAQGNPTVSCYTCHRGRTSPQGIPPLPLPSPRSIAGGASPAGEPGAGSRTAPNTTVLPSVDDILNKYMNAIGGRAAIDQIHSCVIKGSTTISSGQFLPYEADQLLPAKAYESFVIQGRTFETVINGARGWSKNGEDLTEIMGQQLADKKLSFPLFMILRLKEQYSSLRVSAADKIDDRDVYVVNAIRSDNKRERLFFDAENGLLRRRISYTPTMIGIIPDQTDFEDYREVIGVKLPFTISVSSLDARSPRITHAFEDIKLNIPVDESKFNKPAALPPPAAPP